MNKFCLIAPDFDDETVAKLHDFIYEFLNVFEACYSYQIARHARNVRRDVLDAELANLDEDEPPF